MLILLFQFVGNIFIIHDGFSLNGSVIYIIIIKLYIIH